MQKNRRSPLFVIGIIVLFLIFCICCVASTFLFFSWSASLGLTSNDIVLQDGNSNTQIAVISINGEITSTAPTGGFWGTVEKDMVTEAIDRLDRAEKDPSVKAIILEINSPGGEVYGSELIANKVKEVIEAGKPIITLMRDMAASGGYYIAAPTTKIVASNSTITGSIGVIFQTMDYDGLYEKIGIKTYTITNSEGDLKVIQGQLDDKTSEGYKVLESIADDTYDQFVNTIAEGRNMTREQVVELADGRIYSGTRAQELGLIDELGYFEKAVEVATDEADLSNPEVIQYIDSDPYLSSLNIRFGSLFNTLENKLNPGQKQGELKIMYLLPL